MDLCGHATLASSHALWATGRVDENDKIYFETRSGTLCAVKNKGSSWIQLDFPSEPPVPLDEVAGIDTKEVISTLKQGLRCQESDLLYVGKNRVDFIVQLPPSVFANLGTPDSTTLGKLDCRGIIVTAEGKKLLPMLSRGSHENDIPPGVQPLCPYSIRSISQQKPLFANMNVLSSYLSPA